MYTYFIEIVYCRSFILFYVWMWMVGVVVCAYVWLVVCVQLFFYWLSCVSICTMFAFIFLITFFFHSVLVLIFIYVSTRDYCRLWDRNNKFRAYRMITMKVKQSKQASPFYRYIDFSLMLHSCPESFTIMFSIYFLFPSSFPFDIYTVNTHTHSQV